VYVPVIWGVQISNTFEGEIPDGRNCVFVETHVVVAVIEQLDGEHYWIRWVDFGNEREWVHSTKVRKI